LLEAADAFGNLPKWTLENVETDLRDARKLITELFPRQADCSFAYPGVEAMCMTVPYQPTPTPYRPIVDKLFEVARSAREGLANPAVCDVHDLESIDARNLTLDDLIVAAEAAIKRFAIGFPITAKRYVREQCMSWRCNFGKGEWRRRVLTPGAFSRASLKSHRSED
jgi:hypothetical protein